MTDGGGRLAMRQRQRRNSGMYSRSRDDDGYPEVDPATARKDRINDTLTMVRNITILAGIACCLAAPVLPAWLVIPSVTGIGGLLAASAWRHFFGHKKQDIDDDKVSTPVAVDDAGTGPSKLNRSLSPSFNVDQPAVASTAIKPDLATDATTLSSPVTINRPLSFKPGAGAAATV